jgi:hypothetical protein
MIGVMYMVQLLTIAIYRMSFDMIKLFDIY